MPRRKRRAKGTGCLVARNGIWYARWTVGGRVHSVSTGFRVGESQTGEDGTKRGAKELAEEFLMERTEYVRARRREDAIATLVRQMQTTAERLRDRMDEAKVAVTVGMLGDVFADSPRRPDCGEGMVEFYRRSVRRLASEIGEDTPVRDVDDEKAALYARRMKGDGLRASTYNKALNALSLVWRTCWREAGLNGEFDPWRGIARMKSDSHVRRAFTREETDRIIEAADGDMKRLVAVMFYTGLRMGDACRFRWEDVRDGAAFVRTAKTGSKVAIPIHPKLAEALGRRRAAGFVAPEMARAYGDGGGCSAVSRKVKRLIEGCGIATSVREDGKRARPDATAHSFRHTFVSRAIEAGVPPHVVQAIVGHSTAAMTERYTHLSDRAVMEAFGKMA